MKVPGRVVRIEGSAVLIWAGPLGACFGCMAQECGKAKREYWARNAEGLDLEPGMWVQLESLAALSLKQAFIAIFLPLFLGIGIFISLPRLFPAMGSDDRMLMAVLAFFLTAGIIFTITRRSFNKRMPKILAILEEVPSHEGLSCK